MDYTYTYGKHYFMYILDIQQTQKKETENKSFNSLLQCMTAKENLLNNSHPKATRKAHQN